MARIRGNREAFGKPGLDPKWTHGDKNGIGTAYSASSRVWFTVWAGIVTEVYYPTVDLPQLRDLQLMVSDGETLFHDELRHLHSKIRPLNGMLGYVVHSRDPQGRYHFEKEIITDPHLPCLLQRVRFSGDPDFLARLKAYVLCAPHLAGGGSGNNGIILEVAGREVLVANKQSHWMALAASHPFSHLSVGYVGASDGWTDVSANRRMTWEFDHADNGNIALTGEIPLSEVHEFTVAVAFGNRLSRALTTLFQALGVPYERQRSRFAEQWKRADRHRLPLDQHSYDGGRLCRTSHQLLLAHEDKTYQGAIIASLSIPWGETRSDVDGLGGYHLVWVRDLVQSATGLLAAGDTQTAFRALVYLGVNQLTDGSFPQNFWIDGRPYFKSTQLDEVAFPILLAHRLWRLNELGEFDPMPMVLAAAGFLARKGPVTQQERWEEVSGYSPSTLAVTIAALLLAAGMARERGLYETASFLEEHADFLEANIERWTVTHTGARYYVRITPAGLGDPLPDDGPDQRTVRLPNIPPGMQNEFPARDIIDPGFLELVRYGVRRADDPIVVQSLQLVDDILKVDTPHGVVWRRYNHDGYGEGPSGEPYRGSGQGRAWPLLTGERGHYELAAGRNPEVHIRSMEGLATPTALLPEQVWDERHSPNRHLRLGRPTAAAVPLMWAHAEYLKLLRSVSDGRVFDLIPEVAARYLMPRTARRVVQVWTFFCPALTTPRGATLRIVAEVPFLLHWSMDDWQDSSSRTVLTGVHFVDIDVSSTGASAVTFTFYWPEAARWEGRDFRVDVS
jgi:glucoamylase